MNIKRILTLLITLTTIIMMEPKTIKAASAKAEVRLTIVNPSVIDVDVRELSSLVGHEEDKDVILNIVRKNIDNNLKVENSIYLKHKWDKEKNIKMKRIGNNKVDGTIQAYKLDTPIDPFNEYKGEVTIVTNYN